MGKFRAEIIITEKGGSERIIPFEFDTIEDLSTRTMATNNPTQPVFDVFANQGKLVLKDKNLVLYNNAINGVFDNTYKFKVILYKGLGVIAKHIINERPYYDFANKTLTLSLGNEIDDWENILLNSFDYPLISEEIYYLIGAYTNPLLPISGVVFENDLEKNKIQIPYYPENNKKNILKNFCQCIGSSLIKTLDEKYYFVDMLGLDKKNKSVYKLLPKHTRNSFKPNIILDNRFTNIEIKSKEAYLEQAEQTVFYKNYSQEELNNDVKFDSSEKYSHEYYSDTTQKITGIKNISLTYTDFNIKSDKYINNKLTEILSFDKATPISSSEDVNKEKYTNSNPFVSFVCKKITYNQIPINAWLYISTIYDFAQWGKQNFSEKDEFPTIEELKANGIYKTEFLDELPSTKFSQSYTTAKEETKYLEIISDRYQSLKDVVYDMGKFKGNFKILSGRQGVLLYAEGKPIELPETAVPDESGSTNEYWGYIEGTAQLVEIIPISASVNYNGTVININFNNNFVSTGTDLTNNFSIENENYLMQTGLNYQSLEDTIPYKISNYLKDFYKDGIRTGDIDVVFSNYVSTDGTKTKSIDTPFQVGDYVIPCKDNQGTPIIIKPAVPEKHTLSYKTSILPILEGEYIGYYFWRETITSKIKIKSIIDVSYEYPVRVATAKKLNDYQIEVYCYSTFGEREMSVDVTIDFEGNITPIYKVVDVQIELDGGAGLQRLKLMENPNITLEDFSTASEPAMAMSLDEETVVESEIDESKDILSNKEEKGEEMTTNGSNDLIGL